MTIPSIRRATRAALVAIILGASAAHHAHGGERSGPASQPAPTSPAAAGSQTAAPGGAAALSARPAGFDMKLVDDFHAFLDKHDEDLVRGYRLSFKAPDSAEAITALEKKLGFAVPAELRAMWTTKGALHSTWFADAWQTLTIDSAAEMAAHPVGLLPFIDHAWGGRPELAAWLPADAAAKLNADYVVFGYRYVDDNVHDYYFFDRRGRFFHLPFDQDDMTAARDQVREMAKAAPAGSSLDELLRDQLTTIREAAQAELAAGE